MKRFWYFVLLVTVFILIKEAAMPNVKKDDVVKKTGLTGVSAGGGARGYNPATPGWREPLANTGRTDRRVLDDNAQTNGLPLTRESLSGIPVSNVPAWIQTLIGGAQGGNTPRNLPITQPSGAEPTRGTLRVNGQRTSGNNEVWVMPDRSIVNAIYPETTPSQTHPPGGFPLFTLPFMGGADTGGSGGSNGFATNYGSNWKRRGGGGGGYSGGYDSAPAWWNAYLRLNNWNI